MCSSDLHFIAGLKTALDAINKKWYQEFDSKYHVSSILKFIQSEMDFSDHDAALVQKLTNEIKYFEGYIEESYTDFDRILNRDCQRENDDSGAREVVDDNAAAALQKSKEEAAAALKKSKEEAAAKEEKKKKDLAAQREIEKRNAKRKKEEAEALAAAKAVADANILDDWDKLPQNIAALKLISRSKVTDLDYFNYVFLGLLKLSVTPEQFLNKHTSDNSTEHRCEAFIQKIPAQAITKSFLCLVPGHSVVAQGSYYVNQKEAGAVRMRNLATAANLASFQEYDQHQQEDFRRANKKTISLFFWNGSIMVVCMRKGTVKISTELEEFAWDQEAPKKITFVKFFEEHQFGDDNHQDDANCQHFHIHCENLLLCIGVQPCANWSGSRTSDLTNLTKALEDDLARLMLRGIFNDNSIFDQRNIRYL